MSVIRDFLRDISPPWLLARWGERYVQGTIGFLEDAQGEAATQALKAPWVKQADSPNDALALIGNERSMPRYSTEAATTYRSRLAGAWEAWLYAGSPRGVEAQLNLYGFDPVALIPAENAEERNDRYSWHFEEPPDHSNWSRFTVALDNPSQFSETPSTYDGSWTYGDHDDAIIYGLGGRYGDWRNLQAICNKWKAGHEVVPCYAFNWSGVYYSEPGLIYDGSWTYETSASTTVICPSP